VTSLDAGHFDEWYAAMSASSRHDVMVQSALGLPPEFESSSLLPWDGIADVLVALALHKDDVLVDLGCGRGGYGLEIARRTQSSLIGIDFSDVAIELAQRRIAQQDVDVVAEFRVGELTATGLPDASAAAMMCIDAMQFAEPMLAGLAECRRVLARGGRLVLTGWEARDLDDEQVPERFRRDVGRALTDSGFSDVQVRDMPEWRDIERAMWQAAVASDTDGDPAMESLRSEGERVLGSLDRTRRVLATAWSAE